MSFFPRPRSVPRVGLAISMGAAAAVILLTQVAGAHHAATWGEKTYWVQGSDWYWTYYRAAVNHGHGFGRDPWEVYGDQGGEDPSAGPFDQMNVQVWQHMRTNCGAWQFRHYGEATRYGVQQNWAYAGSESEPLGNCVKRRAQMAGKFWDGPDFFEDQVVRED